jgi:hypothetical protein
VTFPNTGPGEGPSPKESWHSTLASFRFRVKAVVSGVSAETTAADELESYQRQLATRSLTSREAVVWPYSADALVRRPMRSSLTIGARARKRECTSDPVLGPQ